MKSPKLKRDAKKGSAKYKARVLQGQYQEFKDLFADRGQEFTLDQLEFNKRTPKLKETMKTWSKNKPKEKQLYLETFSSEKWKKLSNAKKQQHTLSKCKGCHHHYLKLQSSFPVKSAIMKGFAKENPFYQARQLPARSKTILNDCTREIYNSFNVPFQKTFGISFEEPQTNLAELKLQKKRTKSERKAELRQTYAKVKDNIEQQMAKTSVER